MTKLRVQPLGSLLIYLFLTISFIFILSLPNLLLWEKSSHDIWTYIYYITFSLSTVFCIFMLLRSIEWAVVSENGIIIKSPFGKIADITWEDIKSITKVRLNTFNSRGAPISAEWIIIKTDAFQHIKKVGFNNKKHPPYFLIANNKNIQTLKLYVQKYGNVAYLHLDRLS